MSGVVLFELSFRGDVWRLEIVRHKGRTYGNWRKWWWDGDVLRPSKAGATIPLERLPELNAALTAYLAESAPVGR